MRYKLQSQNSKLKYIPLYEILPSLAMIDDESTEDSDSAPAFEEVCLPF